MKFKSIAIALGCAMSVAACATVTKGTGDDVTFTSDPDGAKITTRDLAEKEVSQSCITPCELELNRKWTYDVTYEKDGYKTAVGRLEPKLSSDGTAGMAGNILIGGIVGAAVDGATGAMNDLKPNPLHVVLDPVEQTQETVVESVVEDAVEEVTPQEPVS